LIEHGQQRDEFSAFPNCGSPTHFRSGTSLRKPLLAERAGIPISAEEIGLRTFAQSARCRYPTWFCPTTSTGK
jgi:hypothetical protein